MRRRTDRRAISFCRVVCFLWMECHQAMISPNTSHRCWPGQPVIMSLRCSVTNFFLARIRDDASFSRRLPLTLCTLALYPPTHGPPKAGSLLEVVPASGQSFAGSGRRNWRRFSFAVSRLAAVVGAPHWPRDMCVPCSCSATRPLFLQGALLYRRLLLSGLGVDSFASPSPKSTLAAFGHPSRYLLIALHGQCPTSELSMALFLGGQSPEQSR